MEAIEIILFEQSKKLPVWEALYTSLDEIHNHLQQNILVKIIVSLGEVPPVQSTYVAWAGLSISPDDFEERADITFI